MKPGHLLIASMAAFLTDLPDTHAEDNRLAPYLEVPGAKTTLPVK